MWKRIIKDWKLGLLLLVAIFIKLFSLNSERVEVYYTYGFYPVISKVLRIMFGWIPFSIGDLLYIIAAIYLFLSARKLFLLFKRRLRKRIILIRIIRKIIQLCLIIYIVFNVFWGLNYNRQGFATQLQLDVQRYTTEELITLTTALQHKMNTYAAVSDSLARQKFEKNRNIFNAGIKSYELAKKKYSFLSYNYPSLKPSMFSHIGHYFGFTGYYNPFTGEAQLKTTIPLFVMPYVVNHEIAHQLGYGKENEANFVSYLTGKDAGNTEVRYSIYFDMYLYAIGDLKSKDSVAANNLIKQWHPQVKKDFDEFIAYLVKSKNPVEPIMAKFYDSFLRMNNQPKGKMTYNEVLTWLVAYMKKYGVEAI